MSRDNSKYYCGTLKITVYQIQNEEERLTNPYIDASYDKVSYDSLNNKAIKIKVASKKDEILIRLRDGISAKTSLKSEMKISISKLLEGAGDKKFWTFPISNNSNSASSGKTNFTV
jgi:hypothetical protein